MEFEIPRDLIHRLQVTLRTESGLPSYDPDDPTQPSLPTLRQSVAALDPSPPDHRCRYCSGRLTRGPQSMICVYCGGKQPRDALPEPLTFKSTVGYGCLLRSLRLDGSEIVEQTIDKQALKSGQSTPKDKIPLSDLLNLEIPWLAKPKNASQSNSLRNLRGVDLDNLFTYAKDLVSDIEREQAITNKQTENTKLNAFAGQENPVFASKNWHPITEVISSETKDNNGFSSWEADFKSADSGENLKNNMPKGDTWNNPTHIAEQFETKIELINHKNADNIMPSSFDLFPNDRRQIHDKVANENTPTGGHDDSFYAWDNFTSSSDAEDQSKRSFSAKEIKENIADDDSFDAWNNFTSSSNAEDPFKRTSSATEIKENIADDDSFDAWNNFTSSSNAEDPSKSQFSAVEIKENIADDDSSDVWDEFKISSKAQDPSQSSFTVTKIKSKAGNDESSDVWDDFTSSSNTHDPFNSSFSVKEKVTTGNDDIWDDFTNSINTQKISKSSFGATEVKANTVTENKTTTGVDDLSGDRDGFKNSSNIHDLLKNTINTIGNKPTTGVDDSSDVWDGFTSSSIIYVPFKSSVSSVGNIKVNGVNDSSDVWNDFTSSADGKDHFKNSIADSENKPSTEVDYSSDIWDGFTSSSIANDPFKSSITVSDNKSTTILDDSSDIWDDFTSSSSVQNPSNNSNTHNIGGQNLYTVSPSPPDNFQEMDFGSFSQSDVFLGVFIEKNGPGDVKNMQSEASTSNRIKEDGFNSAVKSEDQMESLFSQMHDLSFMLNTELSVPSIKDNLDPSQDLRTSP